ncbi:MAG: O-methyltransferase [Candidatus Aminicenantia bacterium]
MKEKRYQWREENISETDGKVLYNIILENNYKSAIEIGTSTGHSAIWIAWALSKTGGKLITIEINENRYRKALQNFERAGISSFIDARFGDAHELVYKIDGPFDFVFIDADKDWYKNYAIELIPKLRVGGCLTAHNVLNRYMWGIREFLDYIYSLPYMETKIDKSSRSGISISFKRK